MKKLPVPTDSVKDVFETCISTYQDPELKHKLTSVTPILVRAAQDFENRVKTTQTHTIPPEKTVGGIVTSSEMEDVYTVKFSKQGSPGRCYYDRYFSAPPQGICPICGVRIVSTLDHYLPKSKYPALAVTPANLVPSCYDCSLDMKKAITPTSSEEEPLHPYFDDVEHIRWLSVQLTIEGDTLIPTYFASKPNEWSEAFLRRVQHHLDFYKLPSLYGLHASQEIIGCKVRWTHIYRVCGRDILYQLFEDDRIGRERISLNSWQSALYRALLEQLDTLCTWLDLEPQPSA